VKKLSCNNFAFPRLQWLSERVSTLRPTYHVCLVMAEFRQGNNEVPF